MLTKNYRDMNILHTHTHTHTHNLEKITVGSNYTIFGKNVKNRINKYEKYIENLVEN